jgi:FtsP/CotA-like multicopper oxidase with cupredoxin domain
MDVYKIPQPVPVDITFQVKIVCNRMRELNSFNKIIIEKFSSRQAYTVIKGHYIPIIMGNITDESVMDTEKRKYYIQSYEFTMLGFLIDEDEFEVSPAVSRVLQVFETETRSVGRGRKPILPNDIVQETAIFKVGTTIVSEKFDYTTNITISNTSNVTDYDVFINNDFFGTNVNNIQINTGDVLKFEIVKDDVTMESTILLSNQVI